MDPPVRPSEELKVSSAAGRLIEVRRSVHESSRIELPRNGKTRRVDMSQQLALRPPDLHAEGPGDYDSEIVGEASYQDALEALAGSRTHDGYRRLLVGRARSHSKWETSWRSKTAISPSSRSVGGSSAGYCPGRGGPSSGRSRGCRGQRGSSRGATRTHLPRSTSECRYRRNAGAQPRSGTKNSTFGSGTR